MLGPTRTKTVEKSVVSSGIKGGVLSTLQTDSSLARSLHLIFPPPSPLSLSRVKRRTYLSFIVQLRRRRLEGKDESRGYQERDC